MGIIFASSITLFGCTCDASINAAPRGQNNERMASLKEVLSNFHPPSIFPPFSHYFSPPIFIFLSTDRSRYLQNKTKHFTWTTNNAKLHCLQKKSRPTNTRRQSTHGLIPVQNEIIFFGRRTSFPLRFALSPEAHIYSTVHSTSLPAVHFPLQFIVL